MIAKGKDAADLFPAVVKNVVSKNMEVKKLVYVYLMRYAEEQQDLALLSIATFQRGLKVRRSINHLVALHQVLFSGSKSIDSCQCPSCAVQYSRADHCVDHDVSYSRSCEWHVGLCSKNSSQCHRQTLRVCLRNIRLSLVFISIDLVWIRIWKMNSFWLSLSYWPIKPS